MVVCFAICLVAARAVRAERLPIRSFTTADGLGHNGVNKIVRDSRGFLWFATNDGLSRFDGYGFTNYSVEQGLPHRRVRDVLETPAGEFWVATHGGLVQFRPAARQMFTVILPDTDDPDAKIVTALLHARDGTLWCGTRRGLFRLEQANGRSQLKYVDLGRGGPEEYALGSYVTDLLEGQAGSVWVASVFGLYRRSADGRVIRFNPQFGPFVPHFQHLRDDGRGRLWVSTRNNGLWLLDPGRDNSDPRILERYDIPEGLHTHWIYETRETADGRFWLATNYGLVEMVRNPQSSAVLFRAYSRRHGLTHVAPTTLGEDAAGNLWMGTDETGAMRLTRNGVITWSLGDGVVGGVDFVEDARGDLYTIASVQFIPPASSGVPPLARTVEYPILRIGRANGDRFEWLQPAKPFGFGWAVSIVRTRRNEWWIAGDGVVYRYPSMTSLAEINHTRPIRTYGTPGTGEGQVLNMFEDGKGGVWMSMVGARGKLMRWDPGTDALQDMTTAEALPTEISEEPRAFGEDAAGHVWIGFNSGVARLRGGRFSFFRSGAELPPGPIVGICTGTDGSLWLASAETGLIRVDDPAADLPRFRGYTTSDGLSSNVVETVATDARGRIYAATSHGIDRIDPATGEVRHLSVEHDLTPGTVNRLYSDRTGKVWVATTTGLSRYTPANEEPSGPPHVFVTGVRLAGQPRPVSAVGETDVALPSIASGGSRLEIDFVAIGSVPSHSLRYQYRLDGADHDWGPLSTQRTVTYARLTPGRYRFLVRAVTVDGVASALPAVVSFTVLPPIWRTWWFLSAAVLAAAALGFAFHQRRVARLLELERVRARIAHDLHDDLGANLTRIAILSEVAKQGAVGHDAAGGEKLSAIAAIARESVTSMGDIVWAISPDRDALQEVVRKMRHCVEEAFEGRDVAIVFDAPDPSQAASLGIDVRRDVYLIFKEAVNNAARHSRCTKVAIVFRVTGRQLLLEVVDDGIGFDVTARGDGNGLASLRQRAARLGATLDIASGPDQGTRVTLSMSTGGA